MVKVERVEGPQHKPALRIKIVKQVELLRLIVILIKLQQVGLLLSLVAVVLQIKLADQPNLAVHQHQQQQHPPKIQPALQLDAN